MTEKDLLNALRHADDRYIEEARQRAAAVAEGRKPHSIRMHAAAVFIGLAACLTLVLLSLAGRSRPEVTVAESDTEGMVTYKVQTELPAETITAVSAETTVNTTASGKQVTDTAGRTEPAATGKETASGPERKPESVQTTAAAENPTEPQRTEPAGLTYNLVPSGKTGWTPAAENGLANNVYRAEPGEKLRIDLTVRNDPGIESGDYEFYAEGMEIYGIKKGDAYNAKNFSSYVTDENHYTYFNLSGAVCADNSTVCSFFVDVPQNPGRYTVSLTPLDDLNSPLICVSGMPREGYYNDLSPTLDFTFYGLDILVGNTAMPGPAEPLVSAPYYRRLVEAEKISDPDVPYYPVFDDIAYSVNRVAFAAEEMTAHPGDKNVPMRVSVLHNTGFISCKFSLECSAVLKSVKDADGRPVYTVDPAFRNFSCESEQTFSFNNGAVFILDGGSQPNYTADGTVVTFYFDIAEDAPVGESYMFELRLEELQVKNPDGSVSAVRDACGVGGCIRITE